MNKVITIFNLNTGHIDRWVSCPEAMVKIQPDRSEHFVPGQYTSDTHYVDPQTWIVTAKSPRPSLTHDFDYSAKAWVPNIAAAWRAVRASRDQLLAFCDWTQAPDVLRSQTPAVTAAWETYRQALRDITQQPDPHAVVWPTHPTEDGNDCHA